MWRLAPGYQPAMPDHDTLTTQPSGGSDEAASKPESERERQEDFREILEGLRTTLPGIQVVFGFLLIVPFQAAFADLDGVETGLYMTAFLSAAVASALLIAPSALQRLHWLDGHREHDETVIRQSVVITVAGTAAMAVSLVSGAALVVTVVLDGIVVPLVSAAVAIVVLFAWFGLSFTAHSNDG